MAQQVGASSRMPKDVGLIPAQGPYGSQLTDVSLSLSPFLSP